MNTDKELRDKVLEFLSVFKEVFDHDWEYSKEMLGIEAETEEQKKNAAKKGLESIEIISEN